MILECKRVANKILEEVNETSKELTKQFDIKPTLALVRVLGDPASAVYVGRKEKACKENNIISKTIELKESITDDELIEEIMKLNYDNNINAIMVQLPLPNHIDQNKILSIISPWKDADCLNFASIGIMFTNAEVVGPCTPNGIMEVLKGNNVELEGKNVLIINRSILVGKPLVELLQRENATPTLAHSKTKNIDKLIKDADIIITAVGKRNFITKELIDSLEEANKESGRTQVIVDVSINVDENNKLNGDIENNNTANRKVLEDLSTISVTPVPGGIGLTTVASLLNNCIELTKYQML